MKDLILILAILVPLIAFPATMGGWLYGSISFGRMVLMLMAEAVLEFLLFKTILYYIRKGRK